VEIGFRCSTYSYSAELMKCMDIFRKKPICAEAVASGHCFPVRTELVFEGKNSNIS
jgi:hypothetical protein